MEYTILCDGINGFEEHWCNAEDLDGAKAYAASCLEELEGGHADIFNEDGEFVEDIEV